MCEAARKKGERRKKVQLTSGLTACFPIVAKIVASVTASESEPLCYASDCHSPDRQGA